MLYFFQTLETQFLVSKSAVSHILARGYHPVVIAIFWIMEAIQLILLYWCQFTFDIPASSGFEVSPKWEL